MDITDQIRQMLEQDSHVDYPMALMSLRPAAQWALRGDSYDGLEWMDTNDTEAPTKEELDVEIERLTGLKDQLAYRRLRKEAYVAHEEQLDMMYWDLVNGTTTWKDHVDSVKSAHPKPDVE